MAKKQNYMADQNYSLVFLQLNECRLLLIIHEEEQGLKTENHQGHQNGTKDAKTYDCQSFHIIKTSSYISVCKFQHVCFRLSIAQAFQSQTLDPKVSIVLTSGVPNPNPGSVCIQIIDISLFASTRLQIQSFLLQT